MKWIVICLAMAWGTLLLGVGGLLVLPRKIHDAWTRGTLATCILCAVLAIISFVTWVLTT